MIEIELKFKPTKQQKEEMIKDLVFVSEEIFHDVYYDKNDYSLSTNDIWLRSRNDIFMLKKPLTVNSACLKKQNNSPKKEITDLNDIRNELNLSDDKHLDLHEQLIDCGIYDIYKYKNHRYKYKKAEFIIDFDHAIFPDGFECEVCEIEMIIENDMEVEAAIDKIETFAAAYGMQVENVKARLIEYIERINYKHYALLQETSGA
jgi:adenylate cyclase class IV